MFPEEAKWFADALTRLNTSDISPMLNVGSSTGEFRAEVQPHIDAFLFKPLEQRGIRVLHQDLKAAPGVDIVGDIARDEVRAKLADLSFASVMCCNILEHVESRPLVVDSILSMLPRGGYIFLSCPYSYPYHPDPIDTLYRPDVATLAAAFPDTGLVSGEIIGCGTYARDIFRSPASFVRTVARLAIPFYKPRGWLAAWGNLRWLFRSFKATCIVLHKPA